MTGVIKAASARTVVRSVAPDLARGAAAQLVVVPQRSATEIALDEAHDEISTLQAALIEAHDLADKAQTAARETGRQEGRHQAQDDAERRIAAIEKGVALARAAWEERLAGLDSLAVMLAHSALAKVFGDGTGLADLVTRAIRLQTHALRGEGIVAIRVSSHDFPDTGAVDALRTSAATRSVDILVDAALAAGECRLDLQLGHVDLGVRSLGHELDRFFTTLVAEESAA